MCGIFGEINTQPRPDPAGRDAFEKAALAALHHRGPDGHGVYRDHNCVLGHTRLKIIDLSELAAQPMTSASGRNVLVFNGEIYNYVELRESMPPPQGGYRSSGDTEVLLEALDAHGLDALSGVVGMFALGMWDRHRKELVLVRDRMGKKPLYWARTPGGGLRFGSEISALLDDGVLERTTTLDRLAEYLQHGYVAAPRTGFTQISVVPPGSALRARLDGERLVVELVRYWELPSGDPISTRTAFLEQFAATLENAVRIRLRSDVPLGAFLSGGVDSSVVSLIANRAVSGLRTFAIDFAEKRFSEARFAAEVARRLGTDHSVLEVKEDAVASLDALVSIYGDLHGDSSAIPTVALCKAAREVVTVALAGDGGDELLGGYTRYATALAMVSKARRVPDLVLRTARFAGREVLPPWFKGATRLARLSKSLDEFYVKDLQSYSTQCWPSVLKRPSSNALWHDVVAAVLAQNAGRPELLRLMATDVLTYLPEDILVKVDRASMAVGLEVRAPLLDHRLFELVMRAEPEWLSAANGAKLPLRSLYGEALPKEVFSRSKMGFGVPLGAWFRGNMRRFAETQLLDPHASVAPALEQKEVRHLLTVHRARLRDESSRIWHLLVMAAWFEKWRPALADPDKESGA